MPVILDLEDLPGDYAVSRLPAGAALPDWIMGEGLVNVTQAEDETSITCLSERVPEGVETARGWAAIKVTTRFEFDEAGVVLAVVRPISEAGLGVFVLSTFYRDYLLVKQGDLARVRELLVEAGHRFLPPFD